MSSFIRTAFPFLIFLSMARCASFQALTRETASPRDQYIAHLSKSGLAGTGMVKQWLAAGEPQRHDSVIVSTPFSETGFISAAEPKARFYRLDAKEGQVVSVSTSSRSKSAAKIFVDILLLKNGHWEAIQNVDTSRLLRHEMKRSSLILIRLQPELLSNVYYSIAITTGPALIIPVQGATNKDIGSFYDDVRTIDGKNRKHEGVDIFAKKGTFVIAPTDGYISRVGTNSLGGKVVYMKDEKREPTYYFAHLDSQIVKPGMNVHQGDVLGTVGNTGNAKFTPSHLHFGVYLNSSIDPIGWIRTVERQTLATPDTAFHEAVFRVSTTSADFYQSIVKKAPVRATLAKDSYLKVIGVCGEWYHVLTATDREGFVSKKRVMLASKGNKFIVKKTVTLFLDAERNALPIATFSGAAEGLAKFKNYRFVRIANGLTGWIDLASID